MRTNNPLKCKQFNRDIVLRRYGLTQADYDSLRTAQDYRCKVCSNHEDICTFGRLVVDHCHKTGRVRGLLCQQCNCAIGKLRDNLDLIVKAGQYLAESQI